MQVCGSQVLHGLEFDEHVLLESSSIETLWVRSLCA